MRKKFKKTISGVKPKERGFAHIEGRHGAPGVSWVSAPADWAEHKTAVLIPDQPPFPGLVPETVPSGSPGAPEKP